MDRLARFGSGAPKIVLAPDSFKGTMPAVRVCEIMAGAILRHFPDAEVVRLPMADGGEGTLDCFQASVGGERRSLTVSGPSGAPVDASWLLLENGTAVIEMAQAAGLHLTGETDDPLAAGAYGVGELVRAALDAGSGRILLGLGGSATNDGGCGMAAALGVRFTDSHGRPFVPTGRSLRNIARIDADGLCSAAKEAEIVAICDVDNPLFGPSGAAQVFGPQKGADPDGVRLLDEGHRHLANILVRDLGRNVADLPGAGAAGGLGAGAVAFLGATLTSGIEANMSLVGFDARIRGADLILSGEGRIDAQTRRGKVVSGVAKRAKAAGIPLVAVVGDVGPMAEALYEDGVSAIFSTNRVAIPFERARERSEADLLATMDNLMRFAKCVL
jgi:glycerate kinase